eukprot:1051265-Rhodomonas_salina.2
MLICSCCIVRCCVGYHHESQRQGQAAAGDRVVPRPHGFRAQARLGLPPAKSPRGGDVEAGHWQGLMQCATETNAWFITGGTDTGIMKLIGPSAPLLAVQLSFNTAPTDFSPVFRRRSPLRVSLTRCISDDASPHRGSADKVLCSLAAYRHRDLEHAGQGLPGLHHEARERRGRLFSGGAAVAANPRQTE